MKNDYSIRFYFFFFFFVFLCASLVDENHGKYFTVQKFIEKERTERSEVFFQKNIIHFYWKNISSLRRKFGHSTSKHLSSFYFGWHTLCWNVHSLTFIYRLMIIQTVYDHKLPFSIFFLSFAVIILVSTEFSSTNETEEKILMQKHTKITYY